MAIRIRVEKQIDIVAFDHVVHAELIQTWTGGRTLVPGYLPLKTGYVATLGGIPVACLFLWLTNSKRAIIDEGLCDLNGTDPFERISIMKRIVNHTKNEARRLGYDYVTTLVGDRRLARFMRAHCGFTGDEQGTGLVSIL